MFRAAANPYDDIVAKATDENQTSEDWGLLATVWDKVNDDGPTGARNCVGAIQKRLQHRSANVQLYSLTLADSLVMNCKVDLHREISSRAFTQTLTRLVQDRTTHDKVKKRIMQLLKNWSEHFKKDSTLGIVEETYEQLKKSYRVEDPATEAPAVPVSVLKQEEEDMQRAIAESEALARNQPSRTNYGGNAGASTSYGQPQQSGGYNHAGPSNTGGGSNFFTQADGKALPNIQPEPSTSQHGASASAAAGGPSRVKALYDFEPQEDGELAFRKGDVIRVINSAYEGWWKGELDGRLGIFPLTYIEIIPDPTPESIARDAEMEAQVFTQAGSVDRLLAMLSAADAQGSSISDDDELMELYHQCILMRPKIVKLLDKYNQKQKDLASLHDKFKIAKTAYDTMLEESYSRQNGPMGQQQQYGQPYGQAGYQQQPQPAGAPPQSHYPGQQQYPVQAQGLYQSQGQPSAAAATPVPYMSPQSGGQPAGYAGPPSTSPAPGQPHPHAHQQPAPMQHQQHQQHPAPGQQYVQTQYAPYPPQQQQHQGGMPQPGQPGPPPQVNGYA